MKDAAGSLLDHRIDMRTHTTGENLELLDLLGVISLLCTTRHPHKAVVSRPPREFRKQLVEETTEKLCRRTAPTT